jgi:hypothetical protein
MDGPSPAGPALVLGPPPLRLLVVQHPAAPLWAGSRKALVAVGGAGLWWAVSCRVLLGFLGLFPAGRRVLLLGRQLFFQDAFSAPRSAGSQHWRRKPRPHLGHFSSNYPAGCPARCTWARVGCQGAPPTRRRLGRRRAVASARPSSGQVLAVELSGCTLLRDASERLRIGVLQAHPAPSSGCAVGCRSAPTGRILRLFTGLLTAEVGVLQAHPAPSFGCAVGCRSATYRAHPAPPYEASNG